MFHVRINALLLLAILLAVTGCAQAQIDGINKTCDFTNDPRFASLRGKIPLSMSGDEPPPTVRQISDRSKPSPEEREALLQLDEANSPCRAAKIKLASRYWPSDVVGLLQEVFMAYTNQTRLLIEGQISYGQYMSNTHQIFTQAMQVAGQYERAQQVANAASRQAAAAQLSATMQTIQTFNRQPTVTNCNRLGTGISCTSY